MVMCGCSNTHILLPDTVWTDMFRLDRAHCDLCVSSYHTTGAVWYADFAYFGSVENIPEIFLDYSFNGFLVYMCDKDVVKKIRVKNVDVEVFRASGVAPMGGQPNVYHGGRDGRPCSAFCRVVGASV